MSNVPFRIRRKAEKLRERLNNVGHEPGSTSFSPIFDLFMELAADPGFSALGERDDAAEVIPTLELLVRALAQKPVVKLSLMAAVYIPELSMRHGAVIFDGQPGGYFLFDGDDRGMFGFENHRGETQMTRFTLSRVAPGEAPEHLGPLVPGTH